MAEKTEIIGRIKDELKKYDDKSFKVMFFVVDTKGTPNGSLSYIYDTALKLKNLGYNVEMVYSDEDFVGVESWLGKEYSSLPHVRADEKLTVSPADFLFIPEVYTSVMYQTKDLPCKRVAILQNMGYLTEMIKPGATWEMYGIHDCITTSETLKQKITASFKNLNVDVVTPAISEIFHEPETPRKMYINLVSKDKRFINSVIKPFFWKYPHFKWITFRDLNGLPKEEFADALKEGIATVWDDYNTDFGYSALEAMASGNILIGRVPESTPEWMLKDGKIRNNGVWFFNTWDSQEIISNLITSYIHNAIPSELYDEAKDTVSSYSNENMVKQINDTYVNKLFASRRNEIEETLKIAENK